MYTLKLISEHIEQDTDYLIESKEDGSKSYKIKDIPVPGNRQKIVW